MKKLLITLSILSSVGTFASDEESTLKYGNCMLSMFSHLDKSEISALDDDEQRLASVSKRIEMITFKPEKKELTIKRAEYLSVLFGLFKKKYTFTLSGNFLKTISYGDEYEKYEVQHNYFLRSSSIDKRLTKMFPGLYIESEVGIVDYNDKELVIDLAGAAYKRSELEYPDMDWSERPLQETWYSYSSNDDERLLPRRMPVLSGSLYTCKRLN